MAYQWRHWFPCFWCFWFGAWYTKHRMRHSHPWKWPTSCFERTAKNAGTYPRFHLFPIQIRATFCRAFAEKVKQFWWMAIHDWQYFLLCQQHIMATSSRRWRRCWWAARNRLAAAAGHRSTTSTGCGLALDCNSLNRVWNVKTFHGWKADGCVVRQALLGDHFSLIIMNSPL